MSVLDLSGLSAVYGRIYGADAIEVMKLECYVDEVRRQIDRFMGTSILPRPVSLPRLTWWNRLRQWLSGPQLIAPARIRNLVS